MKKQNDNVDLSMIEDTFESATPVVLEESDAVAIRAETSVAGHVGGGFDTSDFQIPYIAVAFGVGKLFQAGFGAGELVYAGEQLLVPRGKQARCIVVSSGDKYYTEYSPMPVGSAPAKFETEEDARNGLAIDPTIPGAKVQLLNADGTPRRLRMEWSKEEVLDPKTGTSRKQGPEAAASLNIRVLIAEPDGHTCPACRYEIDGKRWCQGMITLTKKSYELAALPYINGYVLPYAPTPAKKRAEPFQLEWTIGTKIIGNNVAIELKPTKIRMIDDPIVVAVKELVFG